MDQEYLVLKQRTLFDVHESSVKAVCCLFSLEDSNLSVDTSTRTERLWWLLGCFFFFQFQLAEQTLLEVVITQEWGPLVSGFSFSMLLCLMYRVTATCFDRSA